MSDDTVAYVFLTHFTINYIWKKEMFWDINSLFMKMTEILYSETTTRGILVSHLSVCYLLKVIMWLMQTLPCVWTCLSFCSPSCSGQWSSVWCAPCCAAPCPSRSWRSRRWCCWSWCSEEQEAPPSRRCCHPGIYFLCSWKTMMT